MKQTPGHLAPPGRGPRASPASTAAVVLTFALLARPRRLAELDAPLLRVRR